jgi:hypothetical protein
MTDLFYAIYTKYLSSTLSELLTELYNTKANEEAVYPYGVFALLNVVADWTFTEEMEDILFQFNLFSNTVDAVQICEAFDRLNDTFHKKDLPIANYESISTVRIGANLTQEEKVWQYNVTFRILLGKL